ncbi:PspA-associated protein PspAA [Nitrososphaera viennensis]|nr:hypothetical protein [Nitrososphaera viennensis]
MTKAKAKARKRAKAVAKSSKPRHAKKIIRLAHKSRPKKAKAAPATKKVVRIMGHGQFTVDARTLKRLNDIDSELVEMVASEKADDAGFKKKLAELNQITIKYGKAVEPGEIVRSDIILPSADLPVDEAKKLFTGEGVIPEN